MVRLELIVRWGVIARKQVNSSWIISSHGELAVQALLAVRRRIVVRRDMAFCNYCNAHHILKPRNSSTCNIEWIGTTKFTSDHGSATSCQFCVEGITFMSTFLGREILISSVG